MVGLCSARQKAAPRKTKRLHSAAAMRRPADAMRAFLWPEDPATAWDKPPLPGADYRAGRGTVTKDQPVPPRCTPSRPAGLAGGPRSPLDRRAPTHAAKARNLLAFSGALWPLTRPTAWQL